MVAGFFDQVGGAGERGLGTVAIRRGFVEGEVGFEEAGVGFVEAEGEAGGGLKGFIQIVRAFAGSAGPVRRRRGREGPGRACW